MVKWYECVHILVVHVIQNNEATVESLIYVILNNSLDLPYES